ncbi:MAG: hypothetical protein RLY71_3976 [Pseudomonadota bacterium]|jgi:hypothetical protein
MPRPLIQSRIDDLEEMFAAAAGKPDVLRQLEHELQFRQVPRALTLLDKVQRANAVAGICKAAEPPVPAAPAEVPGKRDALAQSSVVPAIQMSPISPVAMAIQPERRPTVSSVLTTAAPPAQPVRPAIVEPTRPAPPAMSLADAGRLLNVAPGAPWELIELARRAVVQKSSPQGKGMPDAHLGSALAAARLANSAYATLAVARSAAGKQ